MTDKPKFDGEYWDIPDEAIAAEKRRDAERAKDFEGQWEYVDGVQFTPSPEGGWVGLQAIQSESILGEHDGVLDDDLLEIISKPDGPMRDRYGRPIQAAQLIQLDFGGDPMPQDIFDLVEMLPYGDDEDTEK